MKTLLVHLVASLTLAGEASPTNDEYWIGQLRNGDAVARGKAALALGELRSKKSIPALAKALEDDSKGVRLYAAFSIGDIGVRTPEVIVGLVKALQDKDLSVREAAYNALASIRPNLTESYERPRSEVLDLAIEHAVNELNSDNERYRTRAMHVLFQIGMCKRDKKFGLLLLKHISSNDRELQRVIACSLVNIGVHVDKAVPVLTAMLKEPNPMYQQAAAVYLGRAGVAAKSALPVLQELRGNDVPELRAAVLTAIRNIQNEP